MAESLDVKDVVLSSGEILSTITDEQFRALALNDQAEVLIKVKRLGDFFTKLYRSWEPLVRTKMDAAREDVTQINQVQNRLDGFKPTLGAGKEDKTLTQSEVESFWEQFLSIDAEGAKICFEEIHKVKKAEVTKLRKMRGEAGSMERKRSELIERIFDPQPKKLENQGGLSMSIRD